MKKVGILFVLLSALSFSAASAKSTKQAKQPSKQVANQTVTGRFNQLEAEYETKAFKAQYAELAKQYKAVAKSLDTEIKSLRATVENFAAIEALKGY